MLLSEFRTTLRYHDQLNPKLFNGEVLKSQVREKLIDSANEFAKFSKLPIKYIEDYYFVGGNANYNYTSMSDIDVHLLVNHTNIKSGKINLEDFYKTKKELWANTYEVKIYDYNVEFYVQDINTQFPKNQGVYSLNQNRFLIKPHRVNVDYNDPKLKGKVRDYINQIDSAKTINDVKLIKSKLKTLRGIGLQRGGEFSLDNSLFKELRNLGYIDKLDKKHKKLISMEYSL